MDSLWNSQSLLYHSPQKNNRFAAPQSSRAKKRDREFHTGGSLNKRRLPDPGTPPGPPKGFLRLDSLEGRCITRPTTSEAIIESPSIMSQDKLLHKLSPTQHESRWFWGGGNSQQPPSSFLQQHPAATASPFQMPLNLTTGQHEVWPTTAFQLGQIYASPMSPQVVQQQLTVGYMSIPAVSMSSAVCNIFGQVMDTVVSLSSNLISNLNPNARSFTPLNPNAKEFMPSSREEEEEEQQQVKASRLERMPTVTLSEDVSSAAEEQQEPPEISIASPSNTPHLITPPDSNAPSECCTPVNSHEDLQEDDLKSVALHQVTPWVHSVKEAMLQKDQQVKEKEEERGLRRRRLSSNSDCEFVDEMNSSDLTFENSPRDRSTDRLLSTSSCSSDESSFIEFGSAPPDSPGERASCSSPKFSEATKTTPNCSFRPSLYASDNSEDESEDEDDEDESWDEVDDCESAAALVDIPEFKNCGLLCPMDAFANFRQTNWLPNMQDSSEDPSDGDVVVFESERFPSCSSSRIRATSDESARQRLREVNDRWNDSFHISEESPSADHEKASCDRLVKFSSPDLWKSYFESPELSDELRASRVSDFARRKADLERLGRVIGPVLDKEHRKRVFNRLYGEKEEGC